jgi:hypothetical protein
MSERAREYFNTYAAKREPKYLMIFGWLFSFNWADESWTTITDKERELTHWIRIGKVRNMDGQTCYEIVLGKLLIIFGK